MENVLDSATAISVIATVTAVQVLKSPLTDSWFNKHPVPTLWMVSLIAALVTQYDHLFHLDWGNLGIVITNVFVTALGAALTYNNIVSKWPEVKAAEGEKK